MSKQYHCCATCVHFRVEKGQEKNTVYRCSRLGYETQPAYQFNCWKPKDHVRLLMEKEKNQDL